MKQTALELKRGVEFDGLALVVAGEGPGVLFLHGIGSSSRAFDAQIAGLCHRYRCYAPDAPGYGRSQDRARLRGMDAYAAVYERLMTANNIRAVVGVSFGGVVATRIAVRNRVPLDALVLADSSRGSGIDPARAAAMRQRPRELEADGAETLAARRAPRLVSEHAGASLVAQIAETMAASIRLPGYAQAANAMAETDHTDALADVRCSTLVVVGALDAVCPPSESRRMVRLMPQARFAAIERAGHLANQERPDEFNALVDAFLGDRLPNPSHPKGQR